MADIVAMGYFLLHWMRLLKSSCEVMEEYLEDVQMTLENGNGLNMH